jgi:hypothetical protein
MFREKLKQNDIEARKNDLASFQYETIRRA